MRQIFDLARLELQRADAHPQPHAVHALSHTGHGRQEEQRDGGDPEQVAVRLEDAVVVPEHDERHAEGRDTDGHPNGLSAAVRRVETVDRHDAEGGENGGQREERAVGVRDRPSDDDVGDQVQREEERAPRDGACRDLGVSCHRDARQSDSREQRRDDQPGELAAAMAHRLTLQ